LNQDRRESRFSKPGKKCEPGTRMKRLDELARLDSGLTGSGNVQTYANCEVLMTRVLISDEMDGSGTEILRQAGIDLDVRSGLNGVALKTALRESDAIFVRSDTRITADLLSEPGKLRIIVRGGVGFDTIDVAAATRQRIPVVTTPNSSTISVAEHAIGMIIAVARYLPMVVASPRLGHWNRSKWMGIQLAGKTLGIIGLGRIGSEVARRAIALGMHVAAFDPLFVQTEFLPYGISTVPDLRLLLKRCDILTVHSPLTSETRNLIGASELMLLKKGARVVNCARGGIINEADLAESLRTGHIAGAALDVLDEEPPSPDHPLLQMPNVLITPHIGASTHEAQESVSVEAAKLLIEFLCEGKLRNAVNMDYLPTQFGSATY
jgi:D-3-phosphoglycerate dehydrogenase